VVAEKATSAGLDRRSFEILEMSENLLAESPNERGPTQKANAKQEQRAGLRDWPSKGLRPVGRSILAIFVATIHDTV
jgi:hypothetical protein